MRATRPMLTLKPHPLGGCDESARRDDITKVEVGAADYPVRLMRLDRAPRTLWRRGRLPTAARAVALVGSRAATAAGRERARRLAAALAGRGFDVVSGGAFGIDAAAHEGALETGRTFAVLGCGVDVVYPDRHAALFDRIARAGGLLSEYTPGTPPKRFHFPKRNQLVVALVDAVVVVEAAPRSGALITAELARKAGHPLFASPGSGGAEALLAAGDAHEIGDDASDLVAALDRGSIPARQVRLPLPPPERFAALVAALSGGPVDAGALARRLGLTAAQTMAALTEAELEGWVRRGAGNLFERGYGH